MAILAVLTIVAPIARGAGLTESAEQGKQDVIKRLEEAIRYEVAAKSLPALSIALVDRSGEVWSEGFGFQDAAQNVPATADTIYRVGSVSKLFTDLAVMQLVEQKKLDLDQPVQDYLPSFAPGNPFGGPITLRQLMSHRAGLVREPPVGNYFDPTEPTLAATVASLNATSLVYKPATRTKYSNAGITVVGAVVEQQLNTAYSRRIDEAILRPLGMTSSSFVLTPALEARLAYASMWTYDGRRFAAPKFALGIAPAGNLYSSVRDLAKFLACILQEGRVGDGVLLRPETFKQMTSPRPEIDGKPQEFAIGFQVDELDGQRRIGHGGAVYGFSTEVEALPGRHLGVAVVAALDVSNGTVERLAEYALRLMLAQQDGTALPEYRTTTPIPVSRARELAGEYGSDDRLVPVIELNGRAWMHPGVFRQELRAGGIDGALLTDDPINFGTKVRLDEQRRLLVKDEVFDRRPDEPPPAAPDRWHGLIGEYGWDHNTLNILENHGRLVALIEWFYAYPLKELDDNEFAFPDYGLYHGEKLKFTRDAAGNATHVVAADVRFERRELGTKDGETFHIVPVEPVDALRKAALVATPPVETGDFRESDLVEVVTLDATIKLDVRYATTNNFAGAVFYKQPRAFLQRPAAEALLRVQRRLRPQGLGLLVYDAYRPWYVTKMFWDATPQEFKNFVANPAQGSRHNRGCAVDLSLYNLATGKPISMVAGYDEFSPRSLPLYPGGTSRQRWYRDHLRQAMQAEGFAVYEFEWWHFDYQDWKHYRIGNTKFEDLMRGDPR
jgi:CubicO group peptidase (beta-lactamase class C family)/D-alanyl-D-alanine dipeptidase